MLAKYEQVSYELLRPKQVKALREQCAIVYIPAGTLEWHSFQNPLGTDALKAHAICCEAALKYGGVALPPFYQGLLESSWGPDGWRGYTQSYNDEPMFESAIRGMVKSMAIAGWKVIVGVTGHDVAEQLDAMRRAIEIGIQGTDSTGFAVMEGTLHKADDDLPYRMDHAGAWETACMMYLYPDTVNMDELIPHIASLEADQLVVDWDDVSKSTDGIDGWNPHKYATPELGQKIVERMADLIGKKASEMLHKS
jgi:creatinine amidohydrolase